MVEDPETQYDRERPVFDHDTHIPYAERTIKAIVWVFLVVFLVGGFVAWFFFGFGPSTDDEQEEDIHYSATVNTQVDADVEAEDSSGKSSVYRFFRQMFSGVGDGLDASQFNIDDSPDIYESIETQLELERKADALSEGDDGYRHSLFDVIGSEVEGSADQDAGTIHDILVNRQTGEARVLIVDGDGMQSARDLRDLEFEKVFVQGRRGQIKLSVPETALDSKEVFRYTDDDQEQLISLRRLRAGQLLDFEGNIAGQIDAIIYGNAQAQGLVIDLRPALDRYSPSSYYISFDQARFVENPDGMDLKLTEAQTRALARQLFTNKKGQ